MLDLLVSQLTALEVQGIVNEWLSDRLPDRFTADQGTWQQNGWVVPIILAYPVIGSVGTVGEVLVDGVSGAVIEFTEIAEMKRVGMAVYLENRDAIEAAFS